MNEFGVIREGFLEEVMLWSSLMFKIIIIMIIIYSYFVLGFVLSTLNILMYLFFIEIL